MGESLNGVRSVRVDGNSTSLAIFVAPLLIWEGRRTVSRATRWTVTSSFTVPSAVSFVLRGCEFVLRRSTLYMYSKSAFDLPQKSRTRRRYCEVLLSGDCATVALWV